MVLFLVEVGGEAVRLARGPGVGCSVSSVSLMVKESVRAERESFGGTMKPCGMRDGLGGRRLFLVGALVGT